MRFALGNYLKYNVYTGSLYGFWYRLFLHKAILHTKYWHRIHDYTNNNKTGDAFRTISLFKALILGFFFKESLYSTHAKGNTDNNKYKF